MICIFIYAINSIYRIYTIEISLVSNANFIFAIKIIESNYNLSLYISFLLEIIPMIHHLNLLKTLTSLDFSLTVSFPLTGVTGSGFGGGSNSSSDSASHASFTDSLSDSFFSTFCSSSYKNENMLYL